ncbi:hypothetical protein Cni_G02316 [Canna indica]|uniref:Uncharacterized protein n=1 Tax=Canna indica TaxID=4628 RepID=A0AAQ3JPV9_9LILI|nr:hypothetical protein Cni_G02316 [Canna indica]
MSSSSITLSMALPHYKVNYKFKSEMESNSEKERLQIKRRRRGRSGYEIGRAIAGVIETDMEPHADGYAQWKRESETSDKSSFHHHGASLYLYYVNTNPSESINALPPSESNSKAKDGGADDFEFELYRQQKSPSCLEQQQQKLTSFADELFHSGQLLPLKLPPRLQTIHSANCSRPSSCATSPFAKRSPKSKDIDPFMVALEKVRKEDDATRRSRGSPGRRARSLSPLRTSKHWFNLQEEHGSLMETKISECFNLQETMRMKWSIPCAANDVGSTASYKGLHKRKVMKNLFSMSSVSLGEGNDGKWRDRMKEVFKATRMKPMAKWYGPFMCFGHSL